MKVLICDDLKEETDLLQDLLSNYGITPIVFNDSSNALEYIYQNMQIDICFLDIIMPNLNGIDMAKALREKGYEGKIIFLTSTTDFAYQSYFVEAFDYILKPVVKNNLNKVMDKISNKLSTCNVNGITVHTKNITSFIPFNNIKYVEVINHKVYFHLLNQENISISASLKTIASQLLHDEQFIQCHVSFIVNLNYISTIEGKSIILYNGKIIPISRSFPDIKKSFIKWTLRGNLK